MANVGFCSGQMAREANSSHCTKLPKRQNENIDTHEEGGEEDENSNPSEEKVEESTAKLGKSR